MRPLLPTLLLLPLGCSPMYPGPSDYPWVAEPGASCDPGTGAWTLQATVGHETDPARVVAVFVDIALRFEDPLTGDADLEFLDSRPLTASADGLWLTGLDAGESVLDCGFDGQYFLQFIAEDEEGDQAQASLVIDGLGNPL